MEICAAVVVVGSARRDEPQGRLRRREETRPSTNHNQSREEQTTISLSLSLWSARKKYRPKFGPAAALCPRRATDRFSHNCALLHFRAGGRARAQRAERGEQRADSLLLRRAHVSSATPPHSVPLFPPLWSRVDGGRFALTFALFASSRPSLVAHVARLI